MKLFFNNFELGKKPRCLKIKLKQFKLKKKKKKDVNIMNYLHNEFMLPLSIQANKNLVYYL